MKRTIIISLIIAACVCLAWISSVGADDKAMCKYGKQVMGMREKMKDTVDLEDTFYHKVMFIMANAAELNISDEQSDKIRTLKHSVKKSMIMQEAETEIITIDIMDLLEKDSVDANRVNSLIDKKYEIKKQGAKDLAASLANLYQIITKEQRKMLKDKMTKHMKGMMGMMMGGDGCCPMCGMEMKRGTKCMTEKGMMEKEAMGRSKEQH